jgi:TPR repeat protein
MKKLIILPLILALSACSSMGHDKADKQQVLTTHLNAGKADFAQGKYDVALKDLAPAAEQGDKEAQYALGYMYYYGKGVTQDIFKAQSWFQKSAQQGDVNAQKALKIVNQQIEEEKMIFTPPAKKIQVGTPESA